MARKVKIAAIQIPNWVEGETAQEKYESNLRNIETYLRMAGETGCDLTGVGECSNTRNLSKEEKEEVLPDLLTGPEVEIGKRLAKEFNMNIVLGIAGLLDGKKRNTATVIDRKGEIVGMYLKVQLTRLEKLSGIVPGDDFTVFDLDFGKIGCLICHDFSFAEAARVLAVRGAEIIVWPSNWSGWGRDLSNCMIRCRAIDSCAYVVFLSSGQGPGKPTNWMTGVAGCTGVVNPMGEYIAQMPHRVPGIVTSEVDLDIKRVAHGFTYDREDIFIEEMLCERRPDAYAPLCDASLVPDPPRGYETK
ncbi:MAG: carbon-nitrogen hydrolase family protein [Planctomycetes bacterium]|nr:carbon-nitrogen hydrolase family protein [Planctomycetota bacterium]